MEKNLGHATAYGYAKSKGYSGTEDEFAELMADYASVGQSAAQSAEQATASATSASGSATTASQAAQTATSKASEAVTAAGTATTKASEASTSAQSASQSAESAGTSAQTATTAAATATTKASEASESATTASTAKTDAETARDAAAQSASEAAESARTLTIDATLTQAGQAADAKATGDAITELKNDLDDAGRILFTNDNLFRFTKKRVELNGITLNFSRSGINAKGTATASVVVDNAFEIIGLKPSTTYSLRMFNVTGLGSNQALYLRRGNDIVQAFFFTSIGNNAGERGVTFTTPEDISGIYGRVYFNPNTGTLTDATADIVVVEGAVIPTEYIDPLTTNFATKEELKDSIDSIHEELVTVKGEVYGINVTEKHKKTIAIPSSSIMASTHVFDVAIQKGQYYSFSASFDAEKYAIYANGSLLFPELAPNTKYYFQAANDISYLSIYSNTITSNSIDFELELVDYNPCGGVDYTNEKIDEIKNGYVLIPHILMVGYYISNGSGNHTASRNEFHTNLIDVSPGEEIGISIGYDDSTATVWITAMLYNASKEILGMANVNLSATGKYEGTYTVPADTYYISFQPAMRGGCTFAIFERVDTDRISLPPYYNVNEYIQNKIRTIASTIANAHGDYDVFIFNTDQHWRLNAKNSPKLIHYICDCIPINKMFLGGDLDDGINLQASKAFADAFDGDEYKLIGNHEFMDYVFDLNGKGLSTEITDSLLCAYYGTRLKNVVFGNAERLYYYFDDTARKMRYIILSVFTDDGIYAKYQFEAAQETWFRDVALNLPNGYTAVVLSHALYKVEYGTGAMTLTDPNALQPIVDIINNYSGNGEIACVFVGHMHLDGITTLESGVPVFVTTCDKYVAYFSNGVNTEPWLTSGRIKGTITEQAFDVVVIDKYNKRVSAIRIGAPAYNGGDTELEVRVSSYGN